MTTNRITLIGYVGKALKSNRAANGTSRTALRVATHYKMAKSDEYVTLWHEVICWDRRADFADANFVRGSKIFLGGMFSIVNLQTGKDIFGIILKLRHIAC